MPLSALVDGEKCIGMDIPLDEWKILQKKHRNNCLPIRMIGCNQPGHMVRKNGLQFFRHAPNSMLCNCERGESLQHLRLKYQIYNLFKSHGWEVDVEFYSPDGPMRADVLAWQKDRKIAIEVQWSPISLDSIQDRDKKYTNIGIESYWLLQNLPNNWHFGCKEKYHDLTPTDFYDLEKNQEIDRENTIFQSDKFVKEIRFFTYYGIMIRELSPSIDIPIWIMAILTRDYYERLASGERKIDNYIERKKSFVEFVEQLKSIKRMLPFNQKRLEKCNSFFRLYSNYLDSWTINEIKKIQGFFKDFANELELFDVDLRNQISLDYSNFENFEGRKDKIITFNYLFIQNLERYEWVMMDNENYKRLKKLEASKKKKSINTPEKTEQKEKTGQTRLSNY